MKTIFLILLVLEIPALAQPVVRNDLTTNTTPAARGIVTNIALSLITVDPLHQPSSSTLSNLTVNGAKLSVNNGADLTNIPTTSFQVFGTGWTGTVTNRSPGLYTNALYFHNGILTNTANIGP